MIWKALPAAVAAASMATFGCTQQASAPGGTSAANGNDLLGSATVQSPDGREIKESLVRYYALNGLQKSVDQLTPEERAAVIENLVSLQILSEAAEERGLPRERTIAVELELQRQQLLSRSMVNRFIEDNPASDAELRAEYDAIASELETIEHKARHILLETEQEALSIIEQVNDGADFGQLAIDHSIDPASSNGGDLGWFTSNSMVAAFSSAVEEMEVGTYSSEPIETQFGWHVIMLEDRRANDPPTLDALRDELSNRVTQRKIEAFIDSLR